LSFRGYALEETRGKKPYEIPRELRDDELPGIVAGFVHAAGFDGVEVHGANGYLLDQFLRSGSNLRTGPYGGSLENRARLLLEVTDAVIGVWGADRVAVRISPLNSYNDMKDADPVGITADVARQLNERKIALLDLMRSDFFGVKKGDVVRPARANFSGPLSGNMGYTAAEGAAAIDAGTLNVVCFGRRYVSNPDLVERLQRGLVPVEPDPKTFYSPGPAGYTDYPFLAR
jgi:N-ethylmaleimide reductase